MGRDLDQIISGVERLEPSGRDLVAIDGIGASGKSTLATTIAERVSTRPVHVLHADDFFHPSERRHRQGRYSPEGFWLDTYDIEAFIAVALDPIRSGEPTYIPANVRSFCRPIATIHAPRCARGRDLPRRRHLPASRRAQGLLELLSVSRRLLRRVCAADARPPWQRPPRRASDRPLPRRSAPLLPGCAPLGQSHHHHRQHGLSPPLHHPGASHVCGAVAALSQTPHTSGVA